MRHRFDAAKLRIFFDTTPMDSKRQVDNYGDTSKNLCLAKDKAKAEQEELDIHDAA